MATETERQRNIAFVGPHHSGKTSLVEAVLHHCGAIPRRGNVADGTAVTDHEPEDVAHAQSTTSAFAHCTCDGIDLTIVDAPGFIDFFEDTRLVLDGVDAAVIVIDGEPSRVAQTKMLVDLIEAKQMPHCFVINKLDRPGSDVPATVLALQELYGRHVVVESYPLFEHTVDDKSSGFSGYVDLAQMQAFACDGARETPCAIPAAHLAAVNGTRAQLLEAMADFDDRLMEELLDGIEPPLDEVQSDLCSECAHDQIVPIVVASASSGIGVSVLVRAMERWFPSPMEAVARDVNGEAIAIDDSERVIARVIKTIVHPQSGKLSVVRVVTGTLKADATLTNLSQANEKVRSGGLYRLMGKKSEAIASASPGSIVAIARLDTVHTGDTLAGPNVHTALARTLPAAPCFALAVKPKQRIDEAKIFAMLARIVDEDPALTLTRADATGELLLTGNGEAHVRIAVERLARKYKVEVETSAPAIAYRETISSSTETHSRYKHQTGGHGQFADVKLRFEPRERGSGVSFHERIVGGVVPKQFIPAVEKGVREALLRGPHGHPVTDLAITLYDGAFHDVDSSEQSFRTAAGMAVRDALSKCAPIVLEPLAHVEVETPTACTSAVIGQITSKRGVILSMEPTLRSGFDTVTAEIPEVELSRYITELRTATQGLGSFRSRHERYEPVSSGRSVARASAGG